MTLFLGIYESPTGPLVYAGMSRVHGLRFATNEHGFSGLTCEIEMSLLDSFYLYDRNGMLHVAVLSNSVVIWEGRLEDVSITNGGVRLGAFGYWRALSDAPYTALWSSTRYDAWEVMSPTADGGFLPDRYELDHNQRLYVAPVKNSTLGTSGATVKAGGHAFVAPHNAAQKIRAITFTYSLMAASPWTAVLSRYTFTPGGAWTWLSNVWTLEGNGSLQTGTTTQTFSECDAVVLWLLYNSADAVFGGETGSTYFACTNVRAQGTTSASVYADEIARALVAFINGINSTQLQSSTALIESPSVDLQNAIYEDEYPADILTRLAGYGDASGNTWEVGVWEDKYLHFRERGSQGRTWYVDAADLEVDRSMAELYNSAYAVYQEASGRSLRTSTSAASTQVSRYGITRRAAVGVSTTGSAQAGYYRDTFLTDKKDAKPRVGIKVSAIYDAAGGRWPLWAPRSGDTVVIRNLPPTLSSEIDKIRTFRILETEYDADSDTIEITPEAPRPALDVLVARQGAASK